MEHPITRKLAQCVELSPSDKELLSRPSDAVRSVGPGVDLIREGDPPDGVIVVREGVLARYKQLYSGERQIVALLLPGDFCDVNAALLRNMDHGIQAIGRSKVALVKRSTFQNWMTVSPALKQAIEWATLVDEAILREWLVNLGARGAPQRLAHLFCELRERFRSVQPVGASFGLPLSQQEVGYVLGLSTVHVNRMLGQLREQNLATFRHGRVAITNPERLAAFAGFKPNYLHLARLKS